MMGFHIDGFARELVTLPARPDRANEDAVALGDGIAYNAQVDGAADTPDAASEFGTSARAERLLEALRAHLANH